MVRALGLSILYLALASPAFAHPGHVESGFLHPLTGPVYIEGAKRGDALAVTTSGRLGNLAASASNMPDLEKARAEAGTR